MMKKHGLFLLLIIIALIIGITLPVDAGQRVKYSGVARATSGAVLPSATVTVYEAGSTTPASVYTASSGGTSAAYVTADSTGRWTFYIDYTEYAFTQQFKVVISKDGYTSTTEDYLYEFVLPTNAAGALTNDGSGNYSWGDLGFDESANYSPTGDWNVTGTWDFSGDIEISKVNSAGGSADVLTLSGTLGKMNGSDVFRGIYLNYTNDDHTGGSNYIYGIDIGAITGKEYATENGIICRAGWDYCFASYSPVWIGGNGSTTKGDLKLADLDNSAYVTITPADETTSWTMTLPATSPTGLLRADSGTISTTASISSVTIGGFTASKVLASDGDGNATALSSQNVITTGYIDGAVNVTVSTDATVTVSGSSGFYINGDDDAITFNLPTASAGLAFCFANARYAQAITVHPYSGDYIILAGEDDDSSDVVSSGAATDQICLLAIDSTYWRVTASTGTWTND